METFKPLPRDRQPPQSDVSFYDAFLHEDGASAYRRSGKQYGAEKATSLWLSEPTTEDRFQRLHSFCFKRFPEKCSYSRRLRTRSSSGGSVICTAKSHEHHWRHKFVPTWKILKLGRPVPSPPCAEDECSYLQRSTQGFRDLRLCISAFRKATIYCKEAVSLSTAYQPK